MSESKGKAERLGRHYLWICALHECGSLLDLAARADKSAGDLSAIAEGAAGHLALEVVGVQGRFGGYADLMQTRDSCRMLAAVIFCQVLVPGNPAAGLASRNDKAHIALALDKPLSALFPDQSDRDRLDHLLRQLRTARDKMIAHADAGAFDIEHGAQVSKLWRFSHSLDGIDFPYWQSVIQPLVRATSEGMLGES